MLNNKEIANKINCNSKDITGKTPLKAAIMYGNLETVKILCNSSKVNICEVDDTSKQYKENSIDFSVFYGHIAIFSKLCCMLILLH